MPRLSRSIARLSLGVLSLSAASVLLGCGLGEAASSIVTTPTASAATSGPALSGTLLGGRNAIIGATINLYIAGYSGYGTGFTKLAYSTTDSNGNFGFNTGNHTYDAWSCPTSGYPSGVDPLVYLVSVGGNAGAGTANPQPVAVTAAVIGPCSTITPTTHVGISEVTTVAVAAAFAPYMYPGASTSGTPGDEGIGTSATTQGELGLYNAWLTYSNNLVGVANGQVYASTTYNGTGTAAGITVTATAEHEKILTMANILAACVNGDPSANTTAQSPCNTLFNAAAPPVLATATSYGAAHTSYTYPTAAHDTWEAALFMILNPQSLQSTQSSYDSTDCTTTTSNYACLRKNIPIQKPFGPDLDDTPTITATDWTIGVTYTSAGTCSDSGGAFFNAASKSAVDAYGNVYFINNSTSTNKKGSIGEISPIGQPLLCDSNMLTTLASGRGLTIDPTGNVWATFNQFGQGILKLPGGASPSTSISGADSNTPYGIVSDISGNIFYTTIGSGGSMYKLPSGGTSFSSYLAPIEASSTTTESINYLATDQLGNIWGVDESSDHHLNQIIGSVAGSTTYAVGKVSVSTGPILNLDVSTAVNFPNVGETLTLSGFPTTCGTASLNGLTITVSAVANTGGPTGFTRQIMASTTGSTFSAVTCAGTATAASTTTVGYTDGTTLAAYGTAIDKSGNIFIGQDTSTGANAGTLVKYTPGKPGSVGTSRSAQFLGGVTATRALTLDGASNIWVGNLYAETGDATATGNYGIAELSSNYTPISKTGSTLTTCSSSVGCPSGGGFIKPNLQEATDMSVDLSGNLWIPQIGYENGSSGTVFVGTSIVKIVGVAVPVVTPFSYAASKSSLATQP